jgi:hypothetical protein
MTTVKIVELTEENELACWYEGQHDPQPCGVTLGLSTGVLTARYNPDIGGIPAEIYHGRVRWFTIDRLTNEAANTFLHEVAPLAQRILDGSEVVWNGHNHIGRLSTFDANAAYDELTQKCHATEETPGINTIEWVDAFDWFGVESRSSVIQELGVTVDTDDSALHRIAEEQAAQLRELAGGDVRILQHAEKFLIALRDELRDEMSYRAPVRDTWPELLDKPREEI